MGSKLTEELSKMNSQSGNNKSKRNSKGNKTRKLIAWSNNYYVRCYILAKDGKTDRQIARVLGITDAKLRNWLANKPSLKKALKDGRKNNGDSGSKQFLDYVYGNLPADLKLIWQEIEQCEEGATKKERLEGLMAKGGVRAMQHLFLHALVCCDFNPTEACSKINISKSELDKWKREPGFSRIMEEFHEHKKNFFEGGLIKLVKRGESSAIIFANRTINRDRGYSERTDVNVNVTNTLISIEELNLPLDVRKVILEAIKVKEEKELLLLEDKSNTIDAEFTNKEDTNGN